MICELLIIWGFVCFFAIGYAVGKRSAISDKIKHELEELKSVWKEEVKEFAKGVGDGIVGYMQIGDVEVKR